MKTCFLALFVLLISIYLGAFTVPYSDVPLISEANLLTGLQRVSPDDQTYENNPTNCWLWQDDKHLCFIMETHVDSTFVPGPVSTRDTSNTADYLRIQLITLPEAYYAYLYQFYATGNLFDAVRETGRADYNFNTNYSYSSSITGNIWKVSGKIPLGELRFKHNPPYDWKIIITRHKDFTSEDFSLPPVKPNQKNDYFAKAYDIQLNQPIKRTLSLDFRPYIVKSYNLIDKTDSFDPDNIGLDIAFNPAQRTRIKLSLNPDFSDVPPDEAADIYNSKYPRYYTENRFFFTEDLDAFGVSYDNFYSRRIIKPTVAFKATGNSKSLNWGVLAARDKEIIESGMILNRDDYFQVLSLMPKTKKLKLANAIISRVNRDYYNHVFSNAYTWNLNNDIRLYSSNSFSIRENDRSTDNEPTTGSVHSLSLSLTPQEWTYNLYGLYISRNMNADAGYLYNRFFHKLGSDLSWDSEESLDIISYQGFSLSWEYWDRYAAQNIEDIYTANYYINFRPKWGLNTSLSKGRELDIVNNDHNVYSADVSTTFFRWQPFSAQLKYTYSQELIYNLLSTHSAQSYYCNLWGTISQKLGYDISGSYINYSYPKGVLANYGGLQSYTVSLDDNYVIFNGEISYTPHQKLSLACGSGFTTYESDGIYNDLSLYGNLRYEFKPNCFFYSGFNTNQLQDEKSTYDSPMGHFVKYTATAYAKVSLSL